MNLKYYLRGLGIGLIVTTIILTISDNISSSAKSTDTDPSVTKETSSSSIIAYDRQTTEAASESSTESTTSASQETTAETTTAEATTVAAATKATTEAATQPATQAPTEAATQPATEAPTPAQPVQSDGGEVTITVKDVYYGTQAADLLYNAGLIDDRDDFVQFLISTGYGKKIHEGVYTIQKGASYETICQTICTK